MEPRDDQLHGRWVLVVGGVAVGLVAISVSAALALGWGWGDLVDSYTLTNAVIGIALTGSGAMIGWFRSRNAVGPVFAAAGLAHLVSAALAPLGMYGIAHAWPVPLTRLFAGVFLGAWGLGLPTLALVALLLFPTGRLPSRRWRAAAWYILSVGILGSLLSMVNPYEVVPGNIASRPLLAIEGLPMSTLENVIGILMLPTTPIVAAGLIVRYVRGDERTRRQLLWLILAFLGIVVINLQRWVTGNGPILLLLSTVLIPIAIAIAIIRYRLLDIRVVLSRAVLYGTLIAVIIALYAGIVAALTLVVPPDADRTVAIVAAVAVALLLAPLRLLLQRVAARAFFGVRDDPARTVATTQGTTGLDGVLDDVRQGLRMPRLALTDPAGIPAISGTDPEDPVHETLSIPGGGDLTVTLRPGERRLHDADRRALALVIPPISAVLRERRLMSEVRTARAEVVEARERERQLLHRDLHDGLGPTLTGAAMRIDAAANLVQADPVQARETLLRARADVGSALDDVRRVVYGLRPVALDDRGLVGALEEETGRTPAVIVNASPLPQLTPAMELAVYRIAMEAITNARRHSAASTVTVDLAATETTLTVTVADDGSPPASFEPGAGIRSLRLRAEELGGNAVVGPVTGGWRVRACLPLAPEPQRRPGSPSSQTANAPART